MIPAPTIKSYSELRRELIDSQKQINAPVKKKIKVCYTCSDYCHKEHKTKFTAWFHSKYIFIRKLFTDKYYLVYAIKDELHFNTCFEGNIIDFLSKNHSKRICVKNYWKITRKEYNAFKKIS